MSGKYHVSDFITARNELAAEIKSYRKEFKDLDRELLRKIKEDDYGTRFWVTKPTLANLIELRQEARTLAGYWRDKINNKSYVMSDGYSLCALSDYHGEVLEGFEKDVLRLTSLIVRIKQGKEPNL